MNINTGYIPLSRKIFEHEFWREKRPLSKFEAWIDLIHSARYEATPRTDFINGKPVTWSRGQLVGSVRFLMERWQWKSITKVENYLKYLQGNGMISVEKGQGISIVTICKFDDYNPVKDSKKTAEGQQEDREKTPKGRGKDKTNKGNKDNKEIKDIILPFGSDVFKSKWEQWKEYKKAEHKFTYKSSISEQAALNDLKVLAREQEYWAVQIIDRSIAKSYKGLFALDNYTQPRQTPLPQSAPKVSLSVAEKDDLFGGRKES